MKLWRRIDDFIASLSVEYRLLVLPFPPQQIPMIKKHTNNKMWSRSQSYHCLTSSYGYGFYNRINSIVNSNCRSRMTAMPTTVSNRLRFALKRIFTIQNEYFPFIMRIMPRLNKNNNFHTICATTTLKWWVTFKCGFIWYNDTCSPLSVSSFKV